MKYGPLGTAALLGATFLIPAAKADTLYNWTWTSGGYINNGFSGAGTLQLSNSGVVAGLFNADQIFLYAKI